MQKGGLLTAGADKKSAPNISLLMERQLVRNNSEKRLVLAPHSPTLHQGQYRTLLREPGTLRFV